MVVRLIELFSGTGSVGRQAKKRGWDVISVDMDPKAEATITSDILKLDYKRLPVPDVVWASPPCQTYSLAGTWVRHRSPQTGKAWSAAAKIGDKVLRKTIEIILYWKRKNPKLKFVIENPRGYMRRMRELDRFHRTTTSYNQYGWPIVKPTDFWSDAPLKLKEAKSNKSLGKKQLLVGRDHEVVKQLLKKSPQAAKVSNPSKITSVLYQIPPRLVKSILDQLSPP